MIRTIIIDDDPNNIEALRQLLLKYCPLIELTGVAINELQSAVQKAAERIKTKNITSKIDTLMYNLSVSKPVLQKVALPTLYGLFFVNINELVWLEARGSYTFVYMHDQQKIMVSRTLKEFEDILPFENFSRVHQSYIINHYFIKKYNRGRGGTIEMEDGATIEVSMRKKDEFLSKFK